MTTTPAGTTSEAEAIWYREWVCAGVAQQIPTPGDLLPATVGDVALHVQRTTDGDLRAAFNALQHGSCLTVPAQCRGGHKIRCPYVSCAFSLDTDALSAKDDEAARSMWQFTGSDPQRLMTAPLSQVGPLLFVSLAGVAGLPSRPPPIPGRLPFGLASMCYAGRFWLTLECNWRAAEESILALLTATVSDSGAAVDLASTTLFPNLVVVDLVDHVAALVIKPTSPAKSMAMTALFVEINSAPCADDDGNALVQPVFDRWRALGQMVESWEKRIGG